MSEIKNTTLKSIDEYNKNPNICKYCEKPILAKYEDRLSDIKRKKFCNNSCSASFNNSNSCNRPKEKRGNVLIVEKK